MEWYVTICIRCRTVRHWVGYKTGLGKTEQQLQQMRQEHITCLACGSLQAKTEVDMGVADAQLLDIIDRQDRELRGGLFPPERARLLNALVDCEKAMPHLLQDETAWQSLWIDYHPPFVERIWRQHGDFRICVHRIYRAEPEEVLFHPHPWPSAMRVLEGVYEMVVGCGEGLNPPSVRMTFLLGPGSVYEMNHPDWWHSVRPVTDVTVSLMVTDKPWDRQMPVHTEKLEPLSSHRKASLLRFGQKHYPCMV